MFGTPPCPNCGSEYLVTRPRTHGYPKDRDGTIKRYYRCFRCFTKFDKTDTDADNE